MSRLLLIMSEKDVDSIVVNNERINKTARDVYAEENANPVIYDIERLVEMGLQIIEGDIIDHSQLALRHDTHKVATLLYSIINKSQ